jgi:hypothetical protein
MASRSVAIIRAMNDVERLAQIEESALPSEKQDVLRHALLQMARLAGRMDDPFWSMQSGDDCLTLGVK